MVFIYLFSATELYQLLKIPAFIDHFYTHQQQNKDLTLLEFIDIHYAHGIVMDEDYEQDMKLPFKTQDSFNYTFLHIGNEVPKLEVLILRNLRSYKESEAISYVRPFSSNSYLNSIWQPPKYLA